MEEAAQQRPLKIYFIPFLASGHMIPLCDIARHVASRGEHVTIITTSSNAKILKKSNPTTHSHHFRIHIIPSQELGLSDCDQTKTSIADAAKDSEMRNYKAIELLQQPVERFVQQDPPDCIVADFMYTWAFDLANRFRIPRVVFNGYSIFTVCAIEATGSGSDRLVISGLPHPITLKVRPPEILMECVESLMRQELKSHGIIVNNFAELDGEYVEHYEKTTGHKAWHLGPASLLAQEKAERGRECVVSEHECLSWLNSKRPNSVLYISFGSACLLPDRQLYEIASGIEASGQEFIWVVHEKAGETETEEREWLPVGFEERMKTKGMIIRGWAPQLVILDHPAVGGFLTHCGWNSVVEAVSAGVPMITWPVHGEQFYNEKLITEVHGIGVEVGAEEWVVSGYVEMKKVVSRERIEKAVRRLMDGGDDAQDIRSRARVLAKKAQEAVREGGSSHNNLTALLHDLKLLRDSKAT